MATYKVIQDIEAEDKFLGPLTLKQFIYAAVAAVCTYLSFLLITRGAALFALVFLPFILVAGFFAWPWSRDQPTEIWALAKIRFMLKPRRRIWDQSGIKELVTITAPKKIERVLTKNLSESEVRSRLEALANTIDSRGWAIKNVNVNLYSQPGYAVDDSDRLVSAASLGQQTAGPVAPAVNDVLDERTSPTAQYFDKMITKSAEVHKQQAINQMQHAASGTDQGNPPPDYWFMRGETTAPQKVPTGFSTFNRSQVVAPGSTGNSASKNSAPSAAEQELLKKIHADHEKPNPAYGHMHTLKPLSEQTPSSQKPQPAPPQPNPGILQLASNDDLNVATIARQAEKAKKKDSDNEVVISLH